MVMAMLLVMLLVRIEEIPKYGHEGILGQGMGSLEKRQVCGRTGVTA